MVNFKLKKVFSNKSPAEQEKEIDQSYECTYHGWIMVPLHLKDGVKFNHNNESIMLKIGKKVAKSQLTNRPEGLPSLLRLSSAEGFTIQGNNQKPQDPAFLKAELSTIVSVLVTPEYGCAVIMAFTVDDKGNQGIGCDVIRFNKNPSKASKILKKFNASVIKTINCHKNSISQEDMPELPKLQKPYKKNKMKVKSRRSSSHGYMDVGPERRHSVDISKADGGYLTIDMVDSIVKEEIEDYDESGYLIITGNQKLLDQSNDVDYDEFKLQNSNEEYGIYDNTISYLNELEGH